jgi:hypothetical protein
VISFWGRVGEINKHHDRVRPPRFDESCMSFGECTKHDERRVTNDELRARDDERLAESGL